VSRNSWKVRLSSGPVSIRPVERGDERAWFQVRARNAAWLAPWEASSPVPSDTPPTFATMVRRLHVEAREGRTLPFVVEYEGRLAGQLTCGGIAWGSLRSAYLGYWVDESVAGRGVMPTAAAMAFDHLVGTVGLHRVEVNIRPENAASRRVVEKLGFREEGLRPRYLHIDGDWRDHVSYALTAEEVPGGLLARWLAR